MTQPEDEEPSASELLTTPLLKGVEFSQAIKELGSENLKLYLNGQYDFLLKHCNRIQDQLNELRNKVDSNNVNLVRRVEKILTQMTSYMAIIKQMVDIVASYGERLTEQEKAQAKQELEYASLVERQNRFAISLAKLEKNGREIVEEVEDVKQKEEDHGKLEWKLFSIVSIGVAIVAWLLTGDNFAKILIAIHESVGS